MRRAILCAVCLLSVQLGLPDVGRAQRGGMSGDTTSVWVDQFLAGTGRPMVSYRALRRLEAATRGGGTRATLTAWTSMDPVQGFRYEIVSEEGSGLIRSKVLHAVLEAERTMRARGEVGRGALDATNYEFARMGANRDGFVEIALRPKRSDKLLVNGRMLLSNVDGDLVRIEGILAKRPSFWTRRVEVVREYARILGVRVPVAMHTTAHVLVVGVSTFSMTYDYESINGEPSNSGGAQPPRPSGDAVSEPER